MSSLFIGLFTFFLIVDCLILVLLVLMQLPKKDAGVGMAFGGGTADALFGAGSGNLLTKLTKYSAAGFFVLVLLLSVLKSHSKSAAGAELKNELSKPNPTQPDLAPAVTPANVPATNQASNALTVPLSFTTNTTAVAAPPTNVAPATNAPAGPRK